MVLPLTLQLNKTDLAAKVVTFSFAEDRLNYYARGV